MLTVVVLVCSLLATPDPRDCVQGSALRIEKLGAADNDVMCGFGAQIDAAKRLHLDPSAEYLKIMCVRPSVDLDRMPG